MRLSALVMVSLLFFGSVGCQGSGGAQTEAFDHTHQAFDSLLSRNVRDGLVDYQRLLGERLTITRYLEQLAAIGPETFDGFTDDERLAFLINAYNAYTIELILKHYPVSSIQEIPKAWDAFQWSLLGGSFSLNQIEHELIRKEFSEPRIHLALVCAARGCPPLIARPYRPDLLEDQLASASRNYLANRERNHLDRESATLYISKIFEWYGEDFIPRWGKARIPDGSEEASIHRALIGFFSEYMPDADAGFLKANPVQIETLDYDWALNDAD